ncbi:MAG: tyrosine-type recombinase/integrase [Gaiellales bacterium]
MPERGRYGAGSLRQRGQDTWELRVSAGRDPNTGRYVQRTTTFRGTEKQARKALGAFIAKVDSAPGRGTDATVGDLMAVWLDFAADKVSLNTLQGYRSKARHRIVPDLGRVALRDLTGAELERWYRRLLREERLAPSHVRQIHAILRNALAQGVRWGWLAFNPAVAAKPPAVPKRDIRSPEVDDVLEAIETASPEFSVFVRLSAAAGSRRGEVTALQWKDLSLDAGELVFEHSAFRHPDTGEICLKDTKGHANRRIALDEATIEALRQHRCAGEAVAQQCGAGLGADAFVFSPDVDGGRPWDPYHWTTAWRRLREKLNLPRTIRLHDLRHFAATQLLAGGVDVKTVAGRLGHANAATTLNIYGHFVPAADRVAASKMGDLLSR